MSHHGLESALAGSGRVGIEIKCSCYCNCTIAITHNLGHSFSDPTALNGCYSNNRIVHDCYSIFGTVLLLIRTFHSGSCDAHITA